MKKEVEVNPYPLNLAGVKETYGRSFGGFCPRRNVKKTSIVAITKRGRDTVLHVDLEPLITIRDDGSS